MKVKEAPGLPSVRPAMPTLQSLQEGLRLFSLHIDRRITGKAVAVAAGEGTWTSSVVGAVVPPVVVVEWQRIKHHVGALKAGLGAATAS